MKKLIATAMLLMLCSCKSRTTSTETAVLDQLPAFKQPTASELFDLQSKCSALGQKVLDGNIIGNALTHEQVSHYNPNDNRCYVKLSVSTADLRTPPDQYVQHDYLYDGQTGEMLASLSHEGDKRGGAVYDSALKSLMQEKKQSQFDTDAISELIDNFVATDRRP